MDGCSLSAGRREESIRRERKDANSFTTVISVFSPSDLMICFPSLQLTYQPSGQFTFIAKCLCFCLTLCRSPSPQWCIINKLFLAWSTHTHTRQSSLATFRHPPPLVPKLNKRRPFYSSLRKWAGGTQSHRSRRSHTRGRKATRAHAHIKTGLFFSRLSNIKGPPAVSGWKMHPSRSLSSVALRLLTIVTLSSRPAPL